MCLNKGNGIVMRVMCLPSIIIKRIKTDKSFSKPKNNKWGNIS